MIETATNIRMRDAIRAAHQERAQVFANGMSWLLGRKTK
jgi:hypothetical protein